MQVSHTIKRIESLFILQPLFENTGYINYLFDIALSEVKNIQIATKYNITLNKLTDLILYLNNISIQGIGQKQKIYYLNIKEQNEK